MQMKSILVRFRFSSSSGYRKRQTRLTIEHIVTNPSSCQSKLSPRTTISNCFSTYSPSYSSPLPFPLTPPPSFSFPFTIYFLPVYLIFSSPLPYIFFPFTLYFLPLCFYSSNIPLPLYPLTFLQNFFSFLPMTLRPSFPLLFTFNSPPFISFPL